MFKKNELEAPVKMVCTQYLSFNKEDRAVELFEGNEYTIFVVNTNPISFRLEYHGALLLDEVLECFKPVNDEEQKKFDSLTSNLNNGVERYNFSAHKGGSPFNKLLLEGNLDKLINAPNFNPDNLLVQLTINGYTINIHTFNELMCTYRKELENDIKNKLDYFNTEQAVQDKAKDLITAKIGNIREKLDDIEDSLWKLEI